MVRLPSDPTDPAAMTRTEPHPALIAALRRLLQPLVRLLLSQHVSYPKLSELLKSLFVEVAEQEFPLPGRRQTVSRLSLLTGIHRKEVKRRREQRSAETATPSSVSLGAALVARWTGDPRFLDAQGQPLPLPLRSSGSEPSFETLVRSRSSDLPPRSVLDEWLRLGLVHVDPSDRVVLDVRAFVPERGFEEKAFFLGRNLHDHLAAATHNLEGRKPPMLERSVYYGRLTPEAVVELARTAEEVGMQALQVLNRRGLELQKQSEGDPEACLRMNFGLYFYRGSLESGGSQGSSRHA